MVCPFHLEELVSSWNDLSGVTFARTNALIEDDVNGTEYEGFRSSIGQEIGENWNATVYAEQTIESDGVFFADLI